MLGFLRRLLPGSRSKSSQDKALENLERHAQEASAERAGVSSVSIVEAMGKQSKVDGKPIYEYAESHKHDVDKMLECCRAVENMYWSHGEMKLAPEPYYFERAAILSRKAKDYSGEVSVCERWIAMEDDFMAWRQGNQHRGVNISGSPRAKRIRERLPKAKAKLVGDS
ncbi:hypothetical protein MHM84_03765 [Halomonas sp. McH1-25]|uniref:hypothetical protein n=1 Tax=unclassified Halomonas TaxID=2609666 RepID=UPI001EF5415A|nr:MULTISPECIES: hypothetical protein [unclassified Halomonas]MCG7598890.1 hypothetical protein [Halomonas sp. McH1-25]MCP1340853.1 hypothetical protein [Halomonas sp. FL8]MCP1361264.1 hypothetical protein [Halomonas sp. BBD45]MCP1363756.1 hypothetical protein [Halomonas sp. BBD48]